MELNNRLTQKELDQVVQDGLGIEPDNAPDQNEQQGLEEPTEQQEETLGQEEEKVVEEPAEQKPADLPDVEERYKESSKEATSLYFKNKKLTDTIMDANALADPSEEDLRTYAKDMGEDFDNLDTFAKNLLKSSLKNERRFGKINTVIEEYKEVEVWLDRVDTFVNDEKTLNKYPSLANNAEEFKKYASREQRRGMDLDDLTASFLFNLKPKTERAGKSLLLDKGNGRNQPPKPAKLTDADAIALRNRDQKAYKRAIKEGRIDVEY